MEIRLTTVIDNKPVELIETIRNREIEVYRQQDTLDEPVLYFVKVEDGKREVMFKQEIYCEMGQGIGFVSELHFSE